MERENILEPARFDKKHFFWSYLKLTEQLKNIDIFSKNGFLPITISKSTLVGSWPDQRGAVNQGLWLVRILWTNRKQTFQTCSQKLQISWTSSSHTCSLISSFHISIRASHLLHYLISTPSHSHPLTLFHILSHPHTSPAPLPGSRCLLSSLQTSGPVTTCWGPVESQYEEFPNKCASLEWKTTFPILVPLVAVVFQSAY